MDGEAKYIVGWPAGRPEFSKKRAAGRAGWMDLRGPFFEKSGRPATQQTMYLAAPIHLGGISLVFVYIGYIFFIMGAIFVSMGKIVPLRKCADLWGLTADFSSIDVPYHWVCGFSSCRYLWSHPSPCKCLIPIDTRSASLIPNSQVMVCPACISWAALKDVWLTGYTLLMPMHNYSVQRWLTSRASLLVCVGWV